METSPDNELVAIAAELERYWSEQWRRAKEICDLLELRLGNRTPSQPCLHLVQAADAAPAGAVDESARPPLRLVDA